MSAADDAWRLTADEMDLKELHSTNSLAYPEWLAARAAAVAPRETKG